MNIVYQGMTLGVSMPYRSDETWRVWTRLQRAEEELNRRHGQHFNSMGRHIAAYHYHNYDWALTQLSRVDRVRQALEQSGPIARRLAVERLHGIDLTEVWSILISAVRDIALLYGGAVLAGGAIGGVGGAFAGGVGAIPGAVAGAAAGGYVGTWVLTLLGLESFIDGVTLATPEAFQYYENGFREAWGTTLDDQAHGNRFGGNPSTAAFHLGQGHVVLAGALLTVIMAYFIRGRGPDLLKAIERSPRLGRRLAMWMEQNIDRLRNHPALQSRGSGKAGQGLSPSPQPPDKSKSPDKARDRTRPYRMPRVNVPCFKPNDLPPNQMKEFERQIQGQEDGLNRMTVQEYLDGRDAFENKTRLRDRNVALSARDNYRQLLEQEEYLNLIEKGISEDEAEMQSKAVAADKMKTLAALHNPDMVAAGVDKISDFGNRNVNNRIGAQWKKGGRITSLDDAANAVPLELRDTLMNTKLKRCK